MVRSFLDRWFGRAPESLRVDRHELRVYAGGRPQRFRLVHLTDFHLRGWGPLIEGAVERVRALQPDAVALTGDYVDDDAGVAWVARLAKRLRAVAPVFAVLGDNDFDSDGRRRRLTAALTSGGARVLRNEAVLAASRNGATLRIVGVDDPHTGRARLSAALEAAERLRGADAGEPPPCVVLAHSPEIARQADDRVRLYLTGHTHGGQICLPGGIALTANTRGVPRYASGKYALGRGLLYVNRGVGTARIHVRVFCPPEIACFDLV